MQAADYFKQLSLFADLTPEEIMDVLRIARAVTFAPGDVICKRDTPSDCLFVLESGEGSVRMLDAQGDSSEVTRIGPGEVIGELGLVDGQPRSADVIARTVVRAYRIERSEFDAMRRALHPAAFKMLRRIALTVSERLREINDAISDQVVGVPRASLPAGRASLANEPPQRSSRVHSAPARTSRAAASPARSSRAHQPATPASAPQPAKAEPPERSLLRSVLSRLSGVSFK